MKALIAAAAVFLSTVTAYGFETDTVSTSQGNLAISCLGHASLMLSFKGLVIYVDPVTAQADYSELPKADIVLITHHHQDHFDTSAINQTRKQGTKIVMTEKCRELAAVNDAKIMENGDSHEIGSMEIQAVPAYNIRHKRPDGTPFHPKGEGNGYVLTIADKRIYIAGDTENIPEMKNLKSIDIAFLPMNLPYTMTPAMAANATLMFRPKVVYPYHYGKTNPHKLREELHEEPGIEVRVRRF